MTRRFLAGLSLLALSTLAVAMTDDEKTTDGKNGGLHPRVRMSTNRGDIVLELDAEKAPITVQNFIDYAKADFYKGTIFHRVIKGFMIQGGGYTADLTEKKDGLRDNIKNEWFNGLSNEPYTIAMARLGGNPDSASAQFFINVNDNKRLDEPQPDGAGYCVFGKVVDGKDVVDKIRDTEVTVNPKYPSGGQPVVPKEPVIIQNVEVIGDYDADKVKALAEKAKERNPLKEYFEKEYGAENIKTTDSGLMYVVKKEGEGSQPAPTATVKVHYTGWLLNGQKFDSSRDRGEPAEFPLNRVIPGWTEGVGLMKPGANYILLIPPKLGYGERGAPPRIPGNSWLKFDVELLEVK